MDLTTTDYTTTFAVTGMTCGHCVRSVKGELGKLDGVDVACVSPTHQLIADELGWKARVDLASGLQRTWAWHQSQPGD